MQKRYFWRMLTILWCGFIFYQSQKNGTESGMSSKILLDMINGFLAKASEGIQISELFLRKSGHFTEYFILGLFLFKAIHYKRTRFVSLAYAFMLGTIYAVSDEIHQYFIPGRSPSPVDVCIDSAGLLLGCIMSYYAAKFKIFKQRKFS